MTTPSSPSVEPESVEPESAGLEAAGPEAVGLESAEVAGSEAATTDVIDPVAADAAPGASAPLPELPVTGSTIPLPSGAAEPPQPPPSAAAAPAWSVPPAATMPFPEYTAESAQTPAGTSGPRRARPRFGTIFWGVAFLAFAAYLVAATIVPVPPDPTLWLLGGVIAIGLVLVIAGIAAASRRAD